jgi:hypothetical protein
MPALFKEISAAVDVTAELSTGADRDSTVD